MDSKGISLLKNIQGSAEERIQAIFSLLHETTQSSFDALQFCLENDPNPIVRHEAAYVLGEKGDKRSVPILIHSIKRDENKFVIHEATLGLSNLGELSLPDSKPIIMSLLNHEDEGVVDTAEIALQRLNMKLSKQTLKSDPKEIIKDLSNDNKENRIQASFLLMEDASEESIDALIQALRQEPSDIVKHEIIFALGESISYKAIPDLLKIVENEKGIFSLHESLLALATIGSNEVSDTIKRFFNHCDSNIRETAQIAFDRLLS